MPAIVLYAKRKKESILDPETNASYSCISIWILNVLMLAAVFQFIENFVFIGCVVYY